MIDPILKQAKSKVSLEYQIVLKTQKVLKF